MYIDSNLISGMKAELKLENVSKVMRKWFNGNLIKVNPIKFQLILFGRFNDTGPICVNGSTIECQGYV